MGAILLKNMGWTVWCETNIINSHRGDAEVTFYVYRCQIANLVF